MAPTAQAASLACGSGELVACWVADSAFVVRVNHRKVGVARGALGCLRRIVF